MYSSSLNSRDRSGAIAAVAGIHVALLFALLNLSGKADVSDPQPVWRVFDLRDQPPPPPAHVKQRKPKERSGAAAPENVRSEAAAVVAPKPQIIVPTVQHIVATPTPSQA